MSFDPAEFAAEDMTARAISRTLLQFRDAPVFQALLAAFVSELQALIDAAADVQRLRTPAEATGEQLAALGRIVGMSKVSFDYGRFNWFTPDDADYPPDVSQAWVTNSPVGTVTAIDDGTWRNLIEFKVARNFSRYTSIPDIEAAIETAFGVRIGFQFTSDPMEVYVVLPDSTPAYIVAFLTDVRSNKTAEGIYYPPYPMTWRILGTRSLDSLVLTNDRGEFLTDNEGNYLTPR